MIINPFVFGGGPTDPFFANVSCLLHCEGANGSTTLIDQKGHTWTRLNTASTISTAQFKFGSSSLYSPGGDAWNSSSSADYTFGTGDFTIETFARFDSAASNHFVCGWHTNWGIYKNSSDLYLFNGSGNVFIAAGVITPTVWAHIAVARSGSTIRMFVNGTQVGTASDSTNFSSTNFRLMAQTSGGFPMQGYLDEFRVTKGVARYVANFTPPSAAFPDA